ncbi:MAG: transporter substrate-binding domain-containing protein [Proteocatella sp.]
MKKKWYTYFVMVTIIIIFGVNQLFVLEYNVNIFKYIEYSAGYTEKEKAIIKKYSPIVYGGNINEPPLGMYYKENGQYIGLVVDHMSALSIQLGETIISKPMIWDNAMEALKNGETDLCDMIPSKDRSKYYAFTDPVYSLKGIVVVRKGNEYLVEGSKWENIKVGIQKSDYALEHIKKIISEDNIVYTKDVKDAISLLEEGLVDAVVGDEPVIRYYLKELTYMDNYQIASNVIYQENCVLGVPKANEDFIPVLNKSIFMLRKNGVIQKVNEKWIAYPESNARRNTEKLKLILLMTALIIFVTGYTVYMWNRSLKNLVDSKTRELENIKNELEITFNGINNYIVVLDDKGLIKNINQPYLGLVNKTKNEITNQAFTELPIIAEFEKKYNNLIEKILQNNFVNNKKCFENVYEMKSQSGIYYIKIYPLEYDGNDIGRIAIMIEDVTTQRLNQEKLTQENKMSAVGQLAAGVAHELRNPLGIMRNSTFLLNEGWDDEELRNMAIKSIDSSIERSGKIIDNLLNFSKKNYDISEAVNLKEIVEDVVSLYRVASKEKQIEIIIRIEDEIEFTTNSTSLRHILMNLIQNAIDAVKMKGYVSISANVFNENIELMVEDNGDGISKRDLDKIFEPFYTTKDIGKGTGLGLYIVYTEASKLGAQIDVSSHEMKTIFTLKIPELQSIGNRPLKE